MDRDRPQIHSDHHLQMGDWILRKCGVISNANFLGRKKVKNINTTQSKGVMKNPVALYFYIFIHALNCMYECALSMSPTMPRHLISDVHEWINVIPTVPIRVLERKKSTNYGG